MPQRKNNKSEGGSARYEFRVWGKHPAAREKLARLATKSSRETFDDCYLLVDDPEWNAKVRDNTLKIKQLVSERKGFERWSRNEYTSAKKTPSPFDEIFDTLDLDRAHRSKKYNLERAVERLDPDDGVRAVFVTKDRRRYEIDDLVAEVTDIEFADSDEVLYTLSVEGDDLKALVALRKKLGLRDEPNIAMHQAIDEVA